jgi:hypothetical protein
LKINQALRFGTCVYSWYKCPRGSEQIQTNQHQTVPIIFPNTCDFFLKFRQETFVKLTTLEAEKEFYFLGNFPQYKRNISSFSFDPGKCLLIIREKFTCGKLSLIGRKQKIFQDIREKSLIFSFFIFISERGIVFSIMRGGKCNNFRVLARFSPP